MSPGLLLFAHGARDPAWAAPFEAVAEQVRQAAPGLPVRLAFLEFMRPPMAQAGAELVAAGCTRVAVVPLFLGAGGHVRKDVPHQVAALAAAHPGVQWQLCPAIGEAPEVISAMAGVALALAWDTSLPEDPDRTRT
jgi:sirohydrochlorin cobaltochelatase